MNGVETIVNLAGAVALLLWGTRMVRTGVQRALGARLRRMLARALGSRLHAAAAGTVVAFVLQSATATALLAMSFASSGALSTALGLAVMLGADVGSAIAVQLLSLNLRGVSPLLVLVGVILFLASTNRLTRQSGRTLIGIGLVLLSLTLIATESAAIAQSETWSLILPRLTLEPVLAFILAALLTWAMHSSVAFVLLIASLAAGSFIPLEFAFVLVLGSNAGAGLIPLALAWRSARELQRIPFGNLLFRAAGAVVILTALPYLHEPLDPLLELAPIDAMHTVVLFHLGFNLILAIVCLPLTGLGARLCELALRARADSAVSPSPLDNPSHLDTSVVDRPSLALTSATRELLKMADWVEVMLRRALDAFDAKDKQSIDELARMDDEVDRMHHAIKHYLIGVSRNRLDEEDSHRCMELATFAVKLEHIGDIVEKNLLRVARSNITTGRRFSEAGWIELTDLHDRVITNLQLALNVMVSGDLELARQLVEEKEEFRLRELASSQSHMERLRAGRPESMDSSPIHLDVIRDLTQINSIIVSTAYPILERSGELLNSRLRRPESIDVTSTQ